MEKTLSIIMALFVLLSLLACSKDNNSVSIEEKQAEYYEGTEVETFSSLCGKDLVKTLDGENGEIGGYIYACGTEYTAAKELADKYFLYMERNFTKLSEYSNNGADINEYAAGEDKITVLFGQNWENQYSVSVFFNFSM